MSFDDILDDIFDFDEEPKNGGDITPEEENSGLWDTGKKENLWRSTDPVANGVWDSGAGGDPCDACSDPCSDPDACADEVETEVETEDSPVDEEVAVDSPVDGPVAEEGGLFEDLF